MFAVIYQIPARSGVGMIPLAGRPLIERQLQWLRAAGCQRVALEIGSDPESGALSRWLMEQEALRADVAVVLSSRPLGPAEVARRAGFPADAMYLALPADVIGDGDLTVLFRAASAGGARALAAPPPALRSRLSPGILRLIGREGEAPAVIEGAGWAARVGSVRDAMAIGSAALKGRLPAAGGDHIWPIQIHASEVAPGIWIARGARVDPGAELVAPALIGPDVIVRAGARVGPDAFIEGSSVVEAGATVVGATIEEGTIVGEGVLLKGCIASPRRVTELDNGLTAPIEDSLLVGGRRKRAASAWWVRLIALLGLALLAPVACLVYAVRALLGMKSWIARSASRREGALAYHEGMTGLWHVDLVPRLLDVVRGTRALVGVTPDLPDMPGVSPGLVLDAQMAPWGAINVERALSPEGGDVETKLRGRAWYAQAKSVRVDAELLKRLFTA